MIWFDPSDNRAERDRVIEARLREQDPTTKWSVKNQARMHTRNHDKPYASVEDAIAHWPETATAVVARLVDGCTEILAPYGLNDLFELILRPTPGFATDRFSVFEARIREKGWLARWPRLRIIV